MAATSSIKPLAPQNFGPAQAHHLLNRAAFGGTRQQIVALQKLGLDAAVNYLVDYEAIDDSTLANPEYDPDILRPYSTEERLAIQRARRDNDRAVLEQVRAQRLQMEAEDRRQMGELRQWWLARIISTPRPLEEKLVLFWHGHFASNYRTVGSSFLMLKQNVLFRQCAKDNFARLTRSIVRDPAMIKFLNNDSNNRHSPNENLARELMELFTLGEGNYTESDIKEGARALTGYGLQGNDFQFRPALHDKGTKELFGRRGTFDGDDFVQLCLQRRACAEFICLKLYKYFVSDLPDGADEAARIVVESMARQLVDEKWRVGPVLKTLFKSEHFYDAAIVGNMIKNPIQLVVGAIRTLNTPYRDLDSLVDAMTMMGQRLFDPPSVKGWTGGRAWINTSTLFMRQNLATYLLTGKLPYENSWRRDDIAYDPMFLIAGAANQTPAAVVEHLCATLLGGTLHPQRRQEISAFLSARDRPMTSESVIALLLLITALPEYQLC
jgi:hypothetical protein